MGSSFSNRSRSYRRDVSQQLKNVQPGFYVQDVVITDNDIMLAKYSWEMVMSAEETVPFKEELSKKCDTNFNYTSVLTWFYDSFYNHFFQICPDAQPLFHKVSMVSQGRLIAGVISSALNSLKDPTKLREKLTENTIRHNGKGIKSEWYSKMGEALIWALHHVIGDLFDEATTAAWKRIYSFMLSIILPLAVEYEVAESRSSKRKTTDRKAVSNSERMLWTGRRLDEFYVGALIRGFFSENKVQVCPSPSSLDMAGLTDHSDVPKCPIGEYTPVLEDHEHLGADVSVVTTMSGKYPMEFTPLPGSHSISSSNTATTSPDPTSSSTATSTTATSTAATSTATLPLFEPSTKCPFPKGSSSTGSMEKRGVGGIVPVAAAGATVDVEVLRAVNPHQCPYRDNDLPTIVESFK